MVLQRETRTRKFQHWSTTTGQFMTDSIINLQLIVLAQICIHLPSSLMIDPPPYKRDQYAPNMFPAAISVASENSVSTLTTPSDSPDILPTDGTKTIHVLKKDLPVKARVHIGYCCRKHGRKIYYKKTRFYCSTCSDEDKKFYYCQGFSNIKLATRTFFL